MCHWTPSMLLTALQFPHMSTWGLQPSPDWLLGLIQRQPVVLSLPPYLPESSLSILGHGSSNHSTPTVYGHKRRIFLDQCESFPASPDCCSKWVENAVLQIHKTWKMTHMSLVSTATYCSSPAVVTPGPEWSVLRRKLRPGHRHCSVLTKWHGTWLCWSGTMWDTSPGHKIVK